MHLWPQMRKTSKPLSAAWTFFQLVEAPPQSPVNTKCILKRSLKDCGYAIFQIAISHKYFSRYAICFLRNSR